MPDRRVRIDALGREGVPIIFGDERHFAVRFVPGYRSGSFVHAWHHLVLGGRIIGDKHEEGVTTTWVHSLHSVLERVEETPEQLAHPAFAGRDSDELFELIWMANGCMPRTGYEHLPVLEDRVWRNCHIALDETTDPWLIAMVHVEEKLRFLWKRVDNGGPAEDRDQLFVQDVPCAEVIHTLRSALAYIDTAKESFVEIT